MFIQQVTQYVFTKFVFFAISFNFCNALRDTLLESAQNNYSGFQQTNSINKKRGI